MESESKELGRSCLNVSNDCVLIEDVTSASNAPHDGAERFEFVDLGSNCLPKIESCHEHKELLMKWGRV